MAADSMAEGLERTPGPDAVPRAWSIRRRMLIIGVAIASVAWLVGGVAAIVAETASEERQRDARLVHLAEALAALSEHELAEIVAEGGSGVTHVEAHLDRDAFDGRYRFQIWRSGGSMLLRSRHAPAEQPLVASRTPGLADALVDGERLRVYLMRSPTSVPVLADSIEVHVGERLERSPGLLGVLGGSLFAGLLLSAAVVAVLAGWIVVRALRPVAVIEQALQRRRAADTTPLLLDEVPRELVPMVDSLNGLLHRVAERLSRERGFTASAAHELRTPLAALRLRTQVALAEADPVRRERQLAELLPLVDRCSHLIDQLLALARLDHDEGREVPVPLDLALLAEELRAEFAPLAAERAIDMQIALDERRLLARPFALRMLLRNLLANALAHARDGGVVRLASRREGGRTLIEVDDDGPGIAPADRERAFERFVKLGSASGGVGLGLAIVQSVVLAHGGEAELLDSPMGGLRVRVSLDQAGDPAGSPDRAP